MLRPAVVPEVSERTRVLFITSPRAIGADTFIHLLLLKHLPQGRFELHAAGQHAGGGDSEPAEALAALRAIPGVALRPTHFGPSLSHRSRLGRVTRGLQHAAPVALSVLALARYIRKHHIQVLHSTDRPRDAMACVTLAAASGAKSVIHVHVKYGEWMSQGVKWSFGRADALVGVSRFVADSLIDAGYDPARVHAVHNAIETARWDPTLSGEPGRAALGVPEEAPLIVSVSRLIPWKGQAELIRALALVKREIPGTKLAIVGTETPENGELTKRLRALARELGVQDDIMFTGQRRDIAALLAACDVFALPSFEEPFGLVYAEAMAMKRPVVGLNNGATPEVVDHGKGGLLSAPGDIAALAANLCALLRDPALRQRFGEYGRSQVEARFNPRRMASDFDQVYSTVLA